MGDEHNGDAPLLIETADGIQHLPAAVGIQHGGGLVQNDALRFHSDDAGDGDPLLLTARQLMRRMGAVIEHIHRPQGVVHPAADFLRRHPQVFGAEGHVLLHDGGDQLVIWVLKHHAHRAAHLVFERLVAGVHLLDQDGAARGQQHGVEMLGDGGFPAAVVAKKRHEGTLLDGQVDVFQHLERRFIGIFVLKADAVGDNHIHGETSWE